MFRLDDLSATSLTLQEQLVAVQDALLQEGCMLAQLHYNRQLLTRCGMRSWKALVALAQSNDLAALRQRIRWIQRYALYSLAAVVHRQRWASVAAHAVALAGMRSLRQLRELRRRFRSLRLWATSARVAARSQMSAVLRRLSMAVHVAKEAEDWAVLQREEGLQRKVFGSWKEVAGREVRPVR